MFLSHVLRRFSKSNYAYVSWTEIKNSEIEFKSDEFFEQIWFKEFWDNLPDCEGTVFFKRRGSVLKTPYEKPLNFVKKSNVLTFEKS